MSSNLENKDKESITFKEFLKIIVWVFKLYFSIVPIQLLIHIFTSSLLQIYSLLNAFIFGLVIDQIILSVQVGQINTSGFLNIILIFFLIRNSENALGWINGFTRNAIRVRSQDSIKRKLYFKIRDLGVQTIESPEVANTLNRAENNIYNLFEILAAFIRTFAQFFSIIAATITLMTFMPFMVLIIIIVSIPKIIFESRYLQKDWKLYLDNTEEFRKSGNDAYYLMNKNTVPEIFLTGGFHHIDKRFMKFRGWVIDRQMRIYRPWYRVGFVNDLLSELVIIFGFYKILESFAVGLISVGEVTFQFRTLDILSSQIVNFGMNFSDIRQRATRFKEVKAVFDMQSQLADGEKIFPKLQTPPSIKFQNLEFAYPNSEIKVIKNLNLEIKSGEKVAIVGKNGAGKTTLVKLISKFYQPTSGNILINEVENLQDYNSESWHANIGVLMQDYNKYEHMTVKENVIMGDPNKPVDEDEIKKAIEFADAKDFVEAYTNQYDQILSENFKGGTRPSGGQWQKIALARFFYRNAPLLIFDEPTSAIDAESEFKIFNKIYDFFENKTVIIISHRFSTVRNADRIIVLDDGLVLENGSHDELMKLGGKYAEMFRLQAVGYGEK